MLADKSDHYKHSVLFGGLSACMHLIMLYSVGGRYFEFKAVRSLSLDTFLCCAFFNLAR
jgi:hypothetical protein